MSVIYLLLYYGTLLYLLLRLHYLMDTSITDFLNLFLTTYDLVTSSGWSGTVPASGISI